MDSRRLWMSAAVVALCAVAAWSQRAPAAPEPDGTAGFEQIFDGKTLNGWDGDPMFWRVENGTIVAESTPEKVVQANTFLIWRGGATRNFELKAEFKLSAGANSGVQYRSAPVDGGGEWALRGYQADMDGQRTYTGMLYEERGRTFLARRGQFTRAAPDGAIKLVGTPGDGEVLKAFIREGDWNEIHIIVRGNTLTHLINGHVMAIFIDEDPKASSMEGLLGLQMHRGDPMKIEFRNIFYRGL